MRRGAAVPQAAGRRRAIRTCGLLLLRLLLLVLLVCWLWLLLLLLLVRWLCVLLLLMVLWLCVLLLLLLLLVAARRGGRQLLQQARLRVLQQTRPELRGRAVAP
jgi:hypothetical protein